MLIKLLEDKDFIESRIKLLRLEMEELTELKALEYSEGSASGNTSSPTENYILKLEKTEIKIKKLEKYLKKIEIVLSSLSPLERGIIERTVMQKEPYYKLTNEFCLSESRMAQIKKNAIKKLQRLSKDLQN